MSHYFLRKQNIFNGNAVFDEKESAHLVRVLKKKVGDEIQAFDEDGKSYLLRVSDCTNPAQVQTKILSQKNIEQIPLPKLVLCPALIKLPRFEWLLEKAAELGVTEVRPVITQRCIIEFKDKQLNSKLERWQKIVLAACKQCDRNTIPEVFFPQRLKNLLQDINGQQTIFLWEGEKNNFLNAKNLDVFSPQQNTYLLTGPEGGFAVEEVELARQNQVTLLGLRAHILRAETAALAASSIFIIR